MNMFRSSTGRMTTSIVPKPGTMPVMVHGGTYGMGRSVRMCYVLRPLSHGDSNRVFRRMYYMMYVYVVVLIVGSLDVGPRDNSRGPPSLMILVSAGRD